MRARAGEGGTRRRGGQTGWRVATACVWVAFVLGFGAGGPAGAQTASAPTASGSGAQVGAAGLPSSGYWLVASDGGIFSYGAATFHGSTGGIPLAKPIVGMAGTPDSQGYWLVASDGGIFAFGDAGFHGSTGGIALAKPIVGMAATPDGKGYWLVASDGGIFAFGDAGFHGSTGGIALAKPIVGMVPTPDGKGYWLVASDGGIFAFGDAGFHGSTGGIALAKPIVGMTATPDGKGYWLVASDGGIFAFGDAGFHGSTGGLPLVEPIVGMAVSPGGAGYWLVASDGGIFAFGTAQFYGSTGGVPLVKPIVGMAVARSAAGLQSISDIDANRDLVDVSCPVAGWCMAVDSDGYIVNYSHGTWHAPVRVDPGFSRNDDLGDGEFDAVSCPTTTFCMAVSYLDGYTTYDGTSWSAIAFPTPLDTIGNSFHAVSCASPAFCDAEVDNFGDQAQWNSGVWTETTADQSLTYVNIGQGPSNVSCTPSATTQYCIYVANDNQYAVYDEGTWTNPRHNLFSASYDTTAVSCYQGTSCVAVDDNGDAITHQGSSWSASDRIDPLGEIAGAPEDVSCVPGFCGVVDFGGNVIYRVGGVWTAPLAVDPHHVIDAISCATKTFCVAVDFSGHGLVLNPGS